MKMSDKELDKLFSSQLEGMEIEPSVAVWDNIKAEVGAERKSSIIPYLQVAAGIIVLLSVALLFRPQSGKVALHGSDIAVATSGQGVSVITPQTNVEQDMPVQDVQAPKVESRRLSNINTRGPNTVLATTTTAGVDTTTRLIAATDPIKDDPANVQQPDVNTNITVPQARSVAMVQNGAEHAKPLKVLAVNTPPALKDNATAKKKKIHSLGDLFNVMIAKVDKRPNKIIQFENNDEDEGDFGVAGVNLGPIQIKKND